MPHRAVEVKFNEWTEVTLIVDEEFLALNKSNSDLLVLFYPDGVPPVNPPIQTDIDAAWSEVRPKKPFQRPTEAPLGSRCHVKLANDNIDRNFRPIVSIMSP